MLEKLQDRKLWIWALFSVFFLILGFRLAHLTIVEGEAYSQKALDTRLKKVYEIAKRGEIYDRNGILIAGNETAYSVEFLYERSFSKEQQEMTIELFDLLKSRGEKTIEMPLSYQNGILSYATDAKREKWLVDNGFDPSMSAEEVFNAVRDNEQIPTDVDKYTAQNVMIHKGIYLPIRVKDMVFTYDFDLYNFLDYYEIEEGATPLEAFEALKSYYSVDETYSDEEAFSIVLLRHAVRLKGYLKYEPIVIAQNVSKETAVLIQEQNMKFPNVSVEIQPVRYYPHANLASHILGYLGKITETQLENFDPDKGYTKNDIVGKTGIEGAFEQDMKGINGSKWIEVNAVGRFIREINDSIPDPGFKDQEPQAGNDIELTIDIELQEAVRDFLVRSLEALQTGGVYESEFGNSTYKTAYPYANTGAVVVTDVNTGQVLSMVSYPDYDLNLFSTGITHDDWISLFPENVYDPLAPRPLYNIATQTAVQPGSTFKMITGFAGLLQGLDPYMALNDAGYIETKDGRTFGCWLWNRFRGYHGLVNLMQAIEVSCNYYFYDIANGYDYARDRKLPFDLGADLIIDAARTFGLDEASGVEVGEVVLGVPDPEQKKRGLLNYLSWNLKKFAPDYFPENIASDEKLLKQTIEKIITLGKENPTISRGNLIGYLQKSCGIEDYYVAEKLADVVKYSYFNQMNWFEGDTFNLSIGQGGHAYTPVQMAKYISALANGGYVRDLTLVKSIDGVKQPLKEATFIDPEGYIDYLKQGMVQVTEGSRGSATFVFRDFPMRVGAKTGTAQKEGKLPPEDEEEYLLTYLNRLAPSIDLGELEIETARILRERTEKITKLYEDIAAEEDPDLKADLQADLSQLTNNYYLDKGYAMRDALINLSGGKLDDESLDQYKDDYESFTWFVAFAPYDEPEIAVVVLIPQGGSGGNGAAIAKDTIAKYFGLQAKQDAQD